jgi:hypothetical protein
MAHLSRGDTPVSLTRSSQNQKGHTIQKLDTCSKSAQSPMNSGGRASVEKILPKTCRIQMDRYKVRGDLRWLSLPESIMNVS